MDLAPQSQGSEDARRALTASAVGIRCVERFVPAVLDSNRRVAIIGSGIAGLTCAHVLGPHRDVELFEADNRLGGHANTVTVEDPTAGELAIDTGFIVHNRSNYPNFSRLVDELGVRTQPTEMSFAVTDRRRRLTYRATNPSTIFADRGNIARPELWRMLYDITRLWRSARRLLEDPASSEQLTLGEFLAHGSFSEGFVEWHLRPLFAAVWSADPRTLEEASALAFLGFIDNHGLIGFGRRPQWRTIVGGSREYVGEIERRFDGKIHLASPVTAVRRLKTDGVEVVTANGRYVFDEVVFACHTDQTLRLLERPTATEREILGAIRYLPNRAVLHTDTTRLSPNPRAWAAWNYDVQPDASVPGITYDLTTLQQLPGARRYLVSLNMEDRIDSSTVIRTFDYAHPFFDVGAVLAKPRLPEINGVDRIHYCGAWARNGFHEDGMAAALDVCAKLGVGW
jgi:predicted NAD/FAD-binding protein